MYLLKYLGRHLLRRQVKGFRFFLDNQANFFVSSSTDESHRSFQSQNQMHVSANCKLYLERGGLVIENVISTRTQEYYEHKVVALPFQKDRK